MTIALTWTIPLGVVRVIRSLCVCDCRICVDYSTGSCACPAMLCVSDRVGTLPFRLETHFHPLPLRWKNLDTSNSSPHQAREPHCSKTKQTTLTCWQARAKVYFKIMETGPSYQMGLLHQTMWGLVGTSYRGDPLNVGGSSTVNIFGARRRARRQAESS